MANDAEETRDNGSLEQLWRALNKSRWLILASTLVIMAAVTFFTLGQTKVYRATTTLQIDPNPPSPLGQDVRAVVTMGADTFWNNQEYYATQYRILRSRGVAADAVRGLALHKDGAFLQNLPAGKAAAADASERDAVDAVLARLSVEPIKDSRLVAVSFEDADPDRAQRVLSALVDAYLQRNVDDVAVSNTSASKWLNEQLKKLKEDLEQSELALHEYKKDQQILSVSLDDQSNMLREEMKRLNDALTDVRVRREHVQSRARELEKVDTSDPVNLPATELLQSAILNTLREKYISARGDHASLLQSGKGEHHPEPRSKAAQVTIAREALLKEVRNVRGALRSDLAALNREASGLERLNERAKQRAFEVNKLEIAFRRLERTKVNNEKLYGVVLERSKETDLASLMQFNNLRVVEEPLGGRGPVKPRVPLNIALGGVGGLVFGLLLAIGREQLDRTLKTSEDIERELDIPFLGSLPLADDAAAKADDAGLLAHRQPSGVLAEAARGIRTNLLFMSPDRPYRRLLITSPGPGEGKTTVASTIAVALAQAGERVILVDCDLRRPRLHRVFGRVNDRGVSTATLEPASLEAMELETEVPNLSLLPSGPHVPNPAEFLLTDAFRGMLDRLSERYDRVVLDTPPASVVSDAAILSNKVDGIVFVFRSMKTPRDTAKKVLRTLRDVGAPVVGAVLNALDAARLGYGKYHYYHYNYYGRDEKAPQSDSS
ncbi:MAG: polysaccharide biosynthesis tyrosine autokinase [Polyangiaceae bacterium]|nr:polysaccharide biosynthesis tyrosine autokinase [Polyangiaceae bacterium]